MRRVPGGWTEKDRREAERGGEKKTEANRKMKWNDTKRIKNGGIKNETG